MHNPHSLLNEEQILEYEIIQDIIMGSKQREAYAEHVKAYWEEQKLQKNVKKLLGQETKPEDSIAFNWQTLNLILGGRGHNKNLLQAFYGKKSDYVILGSLPGEAVIDCNPHKAKLVPKTSNKKKDWEHPIPVKGEEKKPSLKTRLKARMRRKKRK